ncbi:MAG: hypothetical protein WD603_00315 [Patescibacteria group bacterium]
MAKKSSGAPWLILGGGVFLASLAMIPILLVAAALAGTGGGGGEDAGGSLSGGCDYDKIFSDASAGAEAGKAYVAGKTDKPPAKFIPIYNEISEKKKLGGCGPSILAGIHSIETGFADTGYSVVNFAGAGGPWQFLEPSWQGFAINHNPPCREAGSRTWPAYSVENGACAAAHHLLGGGAPGNWRNGIYSYNNADWYVYAVTLQAQRFAKDVEGGT